MKPQSLGILAVVVFVGGIITAVAILLPGLLFVVAGIIALVGGIWIWIELRRRHLPIAEHQHKQWLAEQDIELQKRVIAHGERHKGSIKRDPNGTVEVIISHRQVQVVEEQQEPLQIEAPAIPSMVRYEDVAAQIPRGHSLLGISENGLETCDFSDLMTMLISGGSSTGKSNTVAIKLHEAMKIGKDTRMVVIDPHKNKPDSLYNKIRQYESRFLTPVAFRDEEIVQALNWFRREFQRRMELSTNELERLPDILLVCDEVYGLVNHREDDRIAKLIKVVSGIAGYESRGYGMYAWFLTQKVSGLKWLRDAVMTTICHKMQTMSERVLASNDDRQVARDMNNWTMPGRVVVFGLNLPVTVTQMPLMHVVEAASSVSIAGNVETPRFQPTETGYQASFYQRNTQPFPVTSIALANEREEPITEPGNIVGNDLKETIRRMRKAGMPHRDIANLVGLAGRKYGTYQQICADLGLTESEA